TATFWCTREALKIMEPKKYGKIINIASTSAISVMGGHSPGYSASKAAVVSLTKTVALDVAGANIQVNCIAPATAISSPGPGVSPRASRGRLSRGGDQLLLFPSDYVA